MVKYYFFTSSITINNQKFPVISMGNPHVLINVDNLFDVKNEDIAIKLQNNKDIFPESVNVNFYTIINKNLVIGGNLIVEGSTTSINSTSTTIVDPILKLANGNLWCNI